MSKNPKIKKVATSILKKTALWCDKKANMMINDGIVSTTQNKKIDYSRRLVIIFVGGFILTFLIICIFFQVDGSIPLGSSLRKEHWLGFSSSFFGGAIGGIATIVAFSLTVKDNKDRQNIQIAENVERLRLENLPVLGRSLNRCNGSKYGYFVRNKYEDKDRHLYYNAETKSVVNKMDGYLNNIEMHIDNIGNNTAFNGKVMLISDKEINETGLNEKLNSDIWYCSFSCIKNEEMKFNLSLKDELFSENIGIFCVFLYDDLFRNKYYQYVKVDRKQIKVNFGEEAIFQKFTLVSDISEQFRFMKEEV